MITVLKEFGRGQITLPKKWRDRFNTNVYIAKETSQGLLIMPLHDDLIQVDEKELHQEAMISKSAKLFKKKSIG